MELEALELQKAEQEKKHQMKIDHLHGMITDLRSENDKNIQGKLNAERDAFYANQKVKKMIADSTKKSSEDGLQYIEWLSPITNPDKKPFEPFYGRPLDNYNTP